jgi:hypothetical protein
MALPGLPQLGRNGRRVAPNRSRMRTTWLPEVLSALKYLMWSAGSIYWSVKLDFFADRHGLPGLFPA